MRRQVIPDSREVSYVRSWSETITEGHLHEHGPSYTCVPFVMFDEGGCVGAWWLVVDGGWWWWSEGSGRAQVLVFVVTRSLLSPRCLWCGVWPLLSYCCFM